jgi:hypothetical protein
VVLFLAGLLAGMVRYFMVRESGGHAGELAEAIWFRKGRLPLLKSLSRARCRW